jgi:5-methylcytosine-specific restriction enzyme subunit McrC
VHLKQTCREFEQFTRSGIPERQLSAMQRLDEAGRQPALDWSRRKYLSTRNWVGTLQVPGWSMDILPKTGFPDTLEAQVRMRLLRMLTVSGMIPVEERDLHLVRSIPGRLLDLVAWGIAKRLTRALLSGIPRTYQRLEDDLPVIRGRLRAEVMARQCPTRLERPPVAFDELTVDTPLTRTLLELCRRLHHSTAWPPAGDAIREATDLLEPIAGVWNPSDLASCSSNTDCQFTAFVAFFRYLMLGRTTGTGRGEAQTLSLLFPMERVFEGYVAGLLRRHAVSLGIGRLRIQSAAVAEHLLLDEVGRSVSRLKPDALIENADGSTRLIIDTKWKNWDNEGPQSHDVYQLHAYAARWQCRDNVLLLPAQPYATARTYSLAHDRETLIRVGFISVDQADADAIESLRALIHDSPCPPGK